MNTTTMLIDPHTCTIQTCSLDLAQIRYIPSKGGNLTYLLIFCGIFLAQLWFGIRYRTWGFMTGMLCGLLLEVLGYAGRVMLSSNPFSFDDFLLYLIPLTIGPAFLSASIYLCLARIITAYGTDLSRWQPRTYTFVFISCDFVSLLLQSAGGAITATSHHNKKTSDMGVNIMIAGLVWQVVSLLLFMALGAEFAWKVRKVGKGMLNPAFREVREGKKFKKLGYALAVATIAIFIRSTFRVVELQEGFDGSIANNQALFMVFEGPFIILATFGLTIIHPGAAFAGAWETAAWSLRGKKVQDLEMISDSSYTSLARTDPVQA